MGRYVPNIKISDYNYELPKEFIASHPADKREFSRLLVADLKKSEISHHQFNDIVEMLDSDTMLILNDTMVISARMKLYKKSGGMVELLLINPVGDSFDPQIALASRTKTVWKCIIGGRNISEGMILKGYHEKHRIEANILTRTDNEADVEFTWFPSDATFSQVISDYGVIPLPPYIKRTPDNNDKIRYQTVYAEHQGSVAAPTAGLHFSDEMLAELENKKVEIARLTLHVGPGTFLPVSAEKISDHPMHGERFFITAEFIDKVLTACQQGKKLIPVGTTSLRTLETLYWLGVKIISGAKVKFNSSLVFGQWESYKLNSKIKELPSRYDAFNAIKNIMTENGLQSYSAETCLLIAPSYKFSMTDGLITNYHIPQSTLVLLVAAFAGDYWKEIYKSALENEYRFLSYGDSSFLINY